MPLTIEDVNSKKVHLEFGNPEHIKLAKKTVIPEGLNKYEVKFECWDSATIVVNANDEKEAEEIANDDFDISDFDIDIRVKKIN